jgi:flagellar protein FliO/FliZ
MLIRNWFGYIRLILIALVIVNLFVHQSIAAEENSPARPGTVANLFDKEDDQVGNEEKEKSESITQHDETNSNSEQPFLLVLKIFFYTILIIGMIYGLRKLLVFQQKKLQPNQLFQNLGGTQLGPNKSLQLVKVGRTVYLLGVAEQISLIKELQDPDEILQLESKVEEETFIPKGIKELIQSKMNRKSQEDTTQSSFQQLLKQSLENQSTKRNKLKDDLHAEEFNHKEGRSK